MGGDFKEKFTLYIWTVQPPMGMQVNTQEPPYKSFNPQYIHMQILLTDTHTFPQKVSKIIF